MTDTNVASARAGGPSIAHDGNAGVAPRVSPPTPAEPALGQRPGPTLAERLDAWTDCVADHPATDRLERLLSDVAAKVVPDGSQARHVLSGAWLGQPLHPLVNDVPTGLWTSAQSHC